MSTAVVGVQPPILKWARESIGLSIEDVALSLKRNAAEIEAWESGAAAPTYPQLEDLAYRLYKRPLATFFLPKPPAEPNVKKEFRTLPDFEFENLASDTRYQLRLAYAYQLSLKELNDGINPSARTIFRDLTVQFGDDVSKVGEAIRHYLGVSLEQQAAWKSADEGLKAWRNAVEEAGVYVFKHSFKQEDISGFCVVDTEFPVIYLNNSTSKTRQTFSLFHELGHILLHVNSISLAGESHIEYLPPVEKKIERFCNALAAELLIPSADFKQRMHGVTDVSHALIAKLARRYHVSREAILRRLLDAHLVDQSYYSDAVKQWANEAAEGESQSGGGDYYATQASYLGEHYLQLVFGKHYQGKLSLEQVADYLGVRTKSVAGLEVLMLKKAVAV